MRSACLLAVVLWLGVAPMRAAEVDYSREIKPLLRDRCATCHGALKQKAKLRVDTANFLRKGGRHGPALHAGDPAGSLLIERVTDTDETRRMPPEGKPLTPEQIAALKAWIQAGAPAPADEPAEADPRQHWAFQVPVRPPVPSANPRGSKQNPVDAFLEEAYQKHALIPNPPADPATLLRRVYLDLIGLPPTRAELHAFLANPTEEAYEQVVDRLLASPQYGERWARHWMDVWRYSDWYGARNSNDNRNSYGQIWRWRDWMVRSLNADKGYDRMIVEMLAADEVAPNDDANLVATGFVVRNWFKWNYDVWKKDLVEHTGKAFLGLTLNCAHCHDHKYDPITQEEYFRFRAFFEPLEIRQDRVPGEPDPGPFQKYVYASTSPPMKSGQVRVMDENLQAETYMFRLGDARNRFEGKPPVRPGVPSCLGGPDLKIEPVHLPIEAQYPGLKPFVQQEETAKRVQEVGQARTELAQSLEQLALLHRQVAAAEREHRPVPPTDRAKLLKQQAAVKLSEARLAFAEADLRALQARIAADEARYRHRGGPAEPLARAASKAERSAALARAQIGLLEAEQKGEAAKIQAARQALTAAETQLKDDRPIYTPLSPVYPAESTGRRTALARWIASRQNPLTARVAVNHLWNWHFGRPLVESTFNFGRSGKLPSHPELLDWLAVEFMDRGWQLKPLHRLLVTSQAYRQRSGTAGSPPENRRRDPDNRYLWHFPNPRLEAEVLRDDLLFVAGNLDPKIGGQELDRSLGLTSHRRSLYFCHDAEARMEFLDLFDEANPCECYWRTVSVVPQQALALVNSTLTRQQAQTLAGSLWDELGRTARAPARQTAFVEAAFEQVLSRPPSAAERAASENFLTQQSALLATRDKDAAAQARIDFVQALFSHPDFITVR